MPRTYESSNPDDWKVYHISEVTLLQTNKDQDITPTCSRCEFPTSRYAFKMTQANGSGFLFCPECLEKYIENKTNDAQAKYMRTHPSKKSPAERKKQSTR